MKEFFIRLKEYINFKENKIKHVIGIMIIVAQIIASAVTIWYMKRLNVLPRRYYVTLVLVLIVLVLLTIVLNFIRKIHVFGKLLGLVICVALVCVCYYGHHTMRLLNGITSEQYDLDTYVLVTLKNSDISDAKALESKTVGVTFTSIDKEATMNAIAHLKEEVGGEGIKPVAYSGMGQLVSALLSENVDAILYNAAFDATIEEVIDGYADSIKVVGNYEIKSVIAPENPTTNSTTAQNTTHEIPTASEPATEATTEPGTYADNISNTTATRYNPANDPNAPGGGGYIGGDNTVDNASKGDITKRCFNILISGNDAYGKLSGKGRSDVNILVTVNPMTKQIVLTNTPRDYFVPFPGITYGNWRDKLTNAGIYGVWTSVAAVGNIYEVEIDYYVRVNFTSFLQIVEALGSIEVYSEYDFTTGGVHFNKGMNTITTGSAALAFARERKSFASGDRQRGKNQMAVITAMLNKVMSPAIITNFVELVNSVAYSVQTNMTMDEITALCRMQIDDGATWTITSQSVTGAGAMREGFAVMGQLRSVILPDQASIDAAKAKIKSVIGN